MYSDCKGLKQYQTRDILDIDNRRLYMIKSDLMTYDFEIRYVKGETNCIVDCLPCRPAWLTGKDKGSDCSQGPVETGHHGPRDKLCIRVFTESRHILRDNPARTQREEIGKKDEDYKTMIQFIKANKSFQEIPTSLEGARMGGEWPKLEILDEFEVIVLRETDTVSKIFSPRQYRPLILEKLHESGRKEDLVFLKTHLQYTWPTICKDVMSHMDNCQKCWELMPSKSQARSSGLPISFENLQPMDWVSTDLAQKVLSDGKKVNFLLIVDRASGFFKVYQLKGTKTRNVISCLQDFNDIYLASHIG